jgi:hypothetical protein
MDRPFHSVVIGEDRQIPFDSAHYVDWRRCSRVKRTTSQSGKLPAPAKKPHEIAVEMLEIPMHVQYVIEVDRLLNVRSVCFFIDKVDGRRFYRRAILVLSDHRSHERLGRAFRTSNREDPEVAISPDDSHIFE